MLCTVVCVFPQLHSDETVNFPNLSGELNITSPLKLNRVDFLKIHIPRWVYVTVTVVSLKGSALKCLVFPRNQDHGGSRFMSYFKYESDATEEQLMTGWWFQIFFIFTPIWEDSPFD